MPTAADSWLLPVLAISCALLVLRVVFHGVWLPVELAGDEAHYWDWSRRPQLSFHTKGPGVAWTIAAGTACAGNTVLAVRCGTWVAWAVGAFGAGWLGAGLAPVGGRRRVAVACTLAFASLAAFQLTGSVMTVDGAMVACWTLATAAVVHGRAAAVAGRSPAAAFAVAGAAVGFGFLFKYTILLAALGLVAACIPERNRILRAPGARLGAAGAFALMLLGLAPVLAWNAQNDWASYHHLMGHVGVPEDAARTRAVWEFRWWWLPEYAGLLLLAPGPFLGLAMFFGTRDALRGGGRVGEAGAARIALWSALPVAALYALVAFRTRIEANWALGAYCGLLPLGVLWMVGPGVEGGGTRLGRRLWRGTLWQGWLVLGLLLLLPAIAGGVDLAAGALGVDPPRLMRRVEGNREFAQAVRDTVAAAGLDPDAVPVVCNYYDRVGLLGFYLPGHPVVRCASYALVGRRSAYDDFADTRFPDDALRGRTLCLVGATEAGWREALRFDRLEEVGTVFQRNRARRVFLARLPREGPLEGPRYGKD